MRTIPGNKILATAVIILTLALLSGFIIYKPFSGGEKKKKFDYIVSLNTKFGDMKIVLYDQTPKHKENFLKLVNEGFYDSTTFHRVMSNFMIQGGDPNSKDDNPKNDGLGGPGYTIPAEFIPEFYHKKGVIAAARQPDAVNPRKESSGSQFYIVQGNKVNTRQLNQMAQYKGITYTPDQIQVYSELGGTPHLDGDYTVFGEVISGINIIDSIASVKVIATRPVENVYMKLSAEKIKRKKITKKYGYTYPVLSKEEDAP